MICEPCKAQTHAKCIDTKKAKKPAPCAYPSCVCQHREPKPEPEMSDPGGE